MAERRVVNASPLIVLARAGYLDLLLEPGGEVIVPESVAREVLAGPDGDAARRALLDDAQARMCARALGLSVIGSLGVVLSAARRGRIEAAAPVIRALRDAGLYIEESVVRAAPAQALGERWG